jgi:hypothetical protein
MIRIVAIKIPVKVWRWNQLVRPMAREKAPIDAVRGHGLISTKWNG